MTERIIAHIDTEPGDDSDHYRTVLDWTVPAADDDIDKFVGTLTKRFSEELRRTIKAHHSE